MLDQAQQQRLIHARPDLTGIAAAAQTHARKDWAPGQAQQPSLYAAYSGSLHVKSSLATGAT